jgi:hypothetical protein
MSAGPSLTEAHPAPGHLFGFDRFPKLFGFPRGTAWNLHHSNTEPVTTVSGNETQREVLVRYHRKYLGSYRR